jgi:hypothetical protein
LTVRAKARIYAAQQMLQTSQTQTLDGLWVLLVSNEGELTAQDAAGRVPVMARAGNDQTYLLVFKNVIKARQFVSNSNLEGAEPRMVVRGNREDIIRIARSAGVVGTLLDYDPSTQKYAAADALA